MLCFPPFTDTYESYFKRLYGSDKNFQDTMIKNITIKYDFLFPFCLLPPFPMQRNMDNNKKSISCIIIEQILKILNLKILIPNFSSIRFFYLSPRNTWGKVAAFRGFIHSETSFFHSLWSFREVVVNGGFNFEWIAFEFLRLDHVRI